MSKNKFKPLELTDSNVKEIFEECAQDEKDENSRIVSLYSTDNSTQLYFDYFKIKDYKKTLEYLFGQLKIAHDAKRDITVSELAINYNGDSWVEDKATFMKFLFLGIATSKISRISKDTGASTKLSIKPTLSPEDPNFEAWYAEHKGEWEDVKAGQEPGDE